MCRTPAPPFTALVASSIWSGVGEVNTSPGQAASSMPIPTKPPCIGSCPEPPPETSPTLPCTGASARTTMLGPKLTLTRSPCAAAMPWSSSVTTSSGLLISFFISSPQEGGQGAEHFQLARAWRKEQVVGERAERTADDRTDYGD